MLLLELSTRAMGVLIVKAVMPVHLNARKRQVLEAIVESHIETAEPVSSRTIARKYHLGVSPATIRNEMADLEEMGLIEQPHTSAGRIPSQPGYRYYVDELMKKRRLTPREERLIRAIFAQKARVWAKLIQRTIKTVKQMTDYLIMLSGPQLEYAALKKVKIIPLLPDNALVVIVAETGWIETRVIELPSEMASEDLQRIEAVFNTHFSGLTFPEISRTILESVYDELLRQRKAVDRILEIIEAVLQEEYGDALYLGGTQNILKQPEYRNLNELYNILNLIEEEDTLRSILLDTASNQITVKIGQELNCEMAKNYSVVTSVYTIGGKAVGAFGLLGPVRMDYARAIAIVEYITQTLSEVLTAEPII
ncbi:heat-inducible transcription repressor HrcA [Thermacetogenium phaeum DSM 12270]|uniref:Heat-inducible transcription repressor HrcA n=1 Tax=Thermacetogenium phaeum (strain ATCC BAA-254 / DSM 26808 / PB) TaxID=1089553 RepID=K4LJV4_THEPS|nr:heat-inducible transcription repressor HrcA [Thermacetogenium phaeum DSM 12270]